MAKPDMHGKVCLVTGSNSGLGKATAMGLAQLGATVILGCRDKQRGEAALMEIKAASGNQLIELMLIDLSLQHSVHSMVAEFEKRYDHLDVLINNAGIFKNRRKKLPLFPKLILGSLALGDVTGGGKKHRPAI